MTTVGFGDLCPISDTERIFITFVLLFGVAVFSYIFNAFRNTLDDLRTIDEDVDDSDELSRFWGFMANFNNHE